MSGLVVAGREVTCRPTTGVAGAGHASAGNHRDSVSTTARHAVGGICRSVSEGWPGRRSNGVVRRQGELSGATPGQHGGTVPVNARRRIRPYGRCCSLRRGGGSQAGRAPDARGRAGGVDPRRSGLMRRDPKTTLAPEPVPPPRQPPGPRQTSRPPSTPTASPTAGASGKARLGSAPSNSRRSSTPTKRLNRQT